MIIRIHGFKKIHHSPKVLCSLPILSLTLIIFNSCFAVEKIRGKMLPILVTLELFLKNSRNFSVILPQKVLVDAVNSLNLVNLSRSTLHSSVVSAFAVLTMDDAIADLNELNWQECCVTSLEKLCSRSNNNHLSLLFPPSSSDPHRSRLQIANHSLVTPKRKISGGGDETCCGGNRELISEAFRSRMRPVKMVPRRKRSGSHVPSGAVCALSAPVDSVSLASSC
ncbi:hypothetical protein PIB30_026894 [Stylosanthes scabra]|uniref:Uncharacterized protein n=1 Tax=Stylosanthes scabra TaxID=79078 RepID=A0ABU6V9H1_9FABA|nr:hypothetical protein [Stylosanthes scabra]